MNKKKIAILFLILAVIVGGFLIVRVLIGGSKIEPEEELRPPEREPGPADTSETILIDLFKSNESGQSGIATVDEFAGQTQIVLQMVSWDEDIVQPAQIRSGNCGNIREVRYQLNNIVNGRSETVVNISARDVTGERPFVVVVYESLENPDSIVSCGGK